MVSYVPGGRSLRDVNVKPKWQPELKYTVYLQTKGEIKVQCYWSPCLQAKYYQKGDSSYSDTRRNSGRHPLPDQCQYRSQAFADRLPGRFPCSEIGSLARVCIPSLGRPKFSEHSNMLIDIKKFVPPENVYHEIHGRIRKRHDFEKGDWKVFDGMYYSNHDVWSRTRNLPSRSLSPLSWISALVGMVNDL